jgi:hypothetical protein
MNLFVGSVKTSIAVDAKALIQVKSAVGDGSARPIQKLESSGRRLRSGTDKYKSRCGDNRRFRGARLG